jgi:DNA mismatch endonuclease, patch repair protein
MIKSSKGHEYNKVGTSRLDERNILISLMADVFDKRKRSEVMSLICGANTKPEILVRKFLFSKGFRFRLNDKKLYGRPDIKLTKYGCLIFVNVCFWHGHAGCKNYVMPKTNKKFWHAKIRDNIKRDRNNKKKLKADGWKVLVIWECELKKAVRDKHLDRLVKKIPTD